MNVRICGLELLLVCYSPISKHQMDLLHQAFNKTDLIEVITFEAVEDETTMIKVLAPTSYDLVQSTVHSILRRITQVICDLSNG